MAGSIRAFTYVTDAGANLFVRADESNVEAINPAATVGAPSAGVPYATIKTARMRRATYRNAGGAVRVIPILQTANIALLPATFTISISTGANTNASVVMSLVQVQGERLSRYPGGDTGFTDGDIP